MDQMVRIITRTAYLPRWWSGLDPLVPRDVHNEDGRSAKGHFDRIRHVELARLHDRRHRVDELAPCVTGLPDRRDHVVDLRLLDSRPDGGVGLLPKPALL